MQQQTASNEFSFNNNYLFISCEKHCRHVTYRYEPKQKDQKNEFLSKNGKRKESEEGISLMREQNPFLLVVQLILKAFCSAAI